MKGGLAQATNLLIDLRENHRVFCSVVTYPAVARDIIMFRLIPTAMHDMEHVEYTVDAFRRVQENCKPERTTARAFKMWPSCNHATFLQEK